MKKQLLTIAAMALPMIMQAQLATDAYQFSQPDIMGTARFMSMGGAFGALGGDLSTLSQNPAGIGVYRNNEASFTLNLEAQQSNATSQQRQYSRSNTSFYFNNAGVVFTVRNPQSPMRNFNIGVTFNKSSSFNRRHSGMVPQLATSVTNYIAALANSSECRVEDLSQKNHDPYNPDYGDFQAPWAAILGYDAYFISTRNPNDGKVHWEGQFGNGTIGQGHFNVVDKGSMDEYNIAFGGNINNLLFWGIDCGIADFGYERKSIWGEDLNYAYVADDNNNIQQTTSSLQLRNAYRLTGSGFNFKLGLILRPIQELRLGIAVHTPTWYSLEQSYFGSAKALYGNHRSEVNQYTNNGFDAVWDYRFRTPWKIIASAAGVIANRFILSADYEWCNYKNMHFTDKYSDEWYHITDDPFYYTNSDIENIYQSSHTVRLGAEARITPNLSVRAGYAITGSPVTDNARDNKTEIFGDGVRMDYNLDNRTYYISGGLGYHHKGFFADVAYVYKNRQSNWYPFPVDVQYPELCPTIKVTNANHRILLTLGYKF